MMARVRGGAAGRRDARRALDRRFEQLRPLVPRAVPPRSGWVRAIREALGMSASDLSNRMGITETSVLRLELSEQNGRVQVDTLQRAAAALDCEFVYALVPKRPLEEMVVDRAQSRANELLGRIDHSMALEGQQVSGSVLEAQLKEHIERLRDEPGLWRDR